MPLNLYAHVGNDPINAVDPTGMKCDTANAKSGDGDNPGGCDGELEEDGTEEIVVRPPPPAPPAPQANLNVISSSGDGAQNTKPAYCNSWGYIIGAALDKTGDISAKVGTVAVGAGVVQVAISPATAGATAVTGGATIATGTTLIAAGAASQTIGKFVKFVAAGGSRNTPYFAADSAAAGITLAPAMSGRATYAVASQIAGEAMPSVGSNPCE